MEKYQIPDLLDKLQSKQAYIRSDAIKNIIKGKINDEDIIVALNKVIENDPHETIRNFARSALDVFGIEHSGFEKSRDEMIAESLSEDNKNQPDKIMEKEPDLEGKAFGIATGFFVWFVLSNLAFLGALILEITRDVSDGFFITVSVVLIWLTTIVVTILLFSNKKIWVGTGVIAAVITHLAIWLTGSLYMFPVNSPILEPDFWGMVFIPAPIGLIFWSLGLRLRQRVLSSDSFFRRKVAQHSVQRTAGIRAIYRHFCHFEFILIPGLIHTRPPSAANANR